MASKRFGRFRQWAGEVIASKDKSIATEETKELEQDIELRKEGLRRLHISALEFHTHLSKRKQSEALGEDEKLLPRDTLGIVMTVHGEELEEVSPFGSALVKFGQAHCKIATLQEAFALTLQSSYIESLERSVNEIKEFDIERKVLETRRLNFDAAIAHLDKINANKKAKDKDRKEAEDEYAKAKAKYEDTAEDIRARIVSIQEREIEQLRDLSSLLDAELNFAKQYVEILEDVKDTWTADEDASKMSARRPQGPMHHFSRSVDIDSVNGSPRPSSKLHSRSNSTPVSRHNTPIRRARTPASESDSASESESDQDVNPSSALSRRSSTRSKPSSRPTSRSGVRKRTDSSATLSSKTGDDKDKKDSRRKSLAGWASSLGLGSGSKKDKDRDLFSSLQDESDADGPEHQKTLNSSSTRSFGSKRTTPSASPVVLTRSLSTKETQRGKIVRALYDFSGSSDELSFFAGDTIVVISEVLDDWWMGELDGKRGLFPTTHTEVVSSSVSSSTPPRPQLPPRAVTYGGSQPASIEEPVSVQSHAHKDAHALHPFGDEHEARELHSLFSPVTSSYTGDTDSIADSIVTDDDQAESYLMPKKKPTDNDGVRSASRPSPPPPRRPAENRKVPPPPPPRRTQSHQTTPSTSLSSLEAFSIKQSASMNGGQSSLKVSPYGRTLSLPDSETGDCVNFQQNPFKAHGMCSNCFRMHNV